MSKESVWGFFELALVSIALGSEQSSEKGLMWVPCSKGMAGTAASHAADILGGGGRWRASKEMWGHFPFNI